MAGEVRKQSGANQSEDDTKGDNAQKEERPDAPTEAPIRTEAELARRRSARAKAIDEQAQKSDLSSGSE